MEIPADKLVSRVIEAARKGDSSAAEQLLPVVYAELRRLAQSMLSKLPSGQTLQATALVHEAYVRLVGREDLGWDGKGHFFGAAARAMRDILVDQARRKGARKHGGDRRRITLDERLVPADGPEIDILDLDEALRRLEREDPVKGRIVMLRYFTGLTAAETGAALGVSTSTVEREWRYIRAWLYRELSGARADSPSTS